MFCFSVKLPLKEVTCKGYLCLLLKAVEVQGERSAGTPFYPLNEAIESQNK